MARFGTVPRVPTEVHLVVRTLDADSNSSSISSTNINTVPV